MVGHLLGHCVQVNCRHCWFANKLGQKLKASCPSRIEFIRRYSW